MSYRLNFLLQVLDGDPWHRNLLRFALNEENPLMEDTMVILTASMATPWSIASSLESWANILEEHISRLKLSPEYIGKCKKRVLRRFQESYTRTSQFRRSQCAPRGTQGMRITLRFEVLRGLYENDISMLK